MCVFAFKELLRFYAWFSQHGLFGCKAFDRVNRRKLLLKLESRGVPTYILRLLSNGLLDSIHVFVGVPLTQIFPHWEWSEARGYIITLTFGVYMDNLSLQLHSSP